MGQFRDLFFPEGQKRVKPRQGFCNIDFQRGFLNKTDIRERVVESPERVTENHSGRSENFGSFQGQGDESFHHIAAALAAWL
jgi:hypothetical protein